MGRGFSVEHLISVFKQTPKHHEFVIKTGNKMYVVREFSPESMTVRELNGLKIGAEEIRGTPPENVILYWYFPFTANQLVLSQVTDESVAEETPKAKPRKKSAKSIG